MTNQVGVRALIIDVDGTLYHQDLMRRMMLRRLLGYCLRRPLRGLRTVRAVQAYRRAQEELRARAGGQFPAPDSQARLACDRSGESFEFMTESVSRWIEREPLDTLLASRRQGVAEFLQAAASSGLKLAVFSDYPAADKLVALGLAQFFEVVVCAQDPEVQAFKPNPRGLEVALQRLDVTADEAVYIGDRPEVDGVAAKAAGVSCVIVGRPANEATEWTQYPDYAQIRERFLPRIIGS